MAEFYVYRIIAKKTTFDKVPSKLKEKVKQLLMSKGFEVTE